MFKPLSGAFKLPYSLEFHHRTTAFQGTFAHQFASRFTPLKSPRSRDNFFEKTVPCSGIKCSGNRHKLSLNGTYAALIPLCPRLCRILKYLVSLHSPPLLTSWWRLPGCSILQGFRQRGRAQAPPHKECRHQLRPAYWPALPVHTHVRLN